MNFRLPSFSLAFAANGSSRLAKPIAPLAKELQEQLTDGVNASLGALAPILPKDTPTAEEFLPLGKAVLQRYSRDNIPLVAAGVAFFNLLAIFPALAALVSLYGLFLNPTDVWQQARLLDDLLPPSASKLLIDGLDVLAKKGTTQLNFALLTSMIVALWSAKAGMGAIMTGLNIAFRAKEERSWLQQNLAALALTVAGLTVTMVAVIGVAIFPAFLMLAHLDGLGLVSLLRWPVLALVILLTISTIYRLAPAQPLTRWRWLSWGSGLATLLIIAGSGLFSFYVKNFGSYDATYGSLGAVVVLLLWYWFGAQMLLLGAEVDAELAGRKRHPKKLVTPAQAVFPKPTPSLPKTKSKPETKRVKRRK